MDPDGAGRVPTRSDFLRQNPGCTNRNFVTLTTSEQLTLSPRVLQQPDGHYRCQQRLSMKSTHCVKASGTFGYALSHTHN